MKDEAKHLMNELKELRQRIAELERLDAQRKKTKELLRGSEEKLRNILDFCPGAVAVTDLKGTIIECNQVTLQMHGFSVKKELIGKNAFDLIIGKDHQRALENINKILKEGFIKNVEYTFLTKDGREFPAELSANVIRDSLGRPVSFVAITKDITERKQIEEALRIERDRFEAVIQNIGVGLAVISKDYRTLGGNEVLKQIFGKVEGKMCYSVFNQRTEVCPGCGAREIFRTGRDKVVHEQKAKDFNGNTIWSEIISTPIKDKEGNITAALEVIVPITKRKKAEQETQAYAQESKESVRLKSEFLANTSHEIRTPLTAISGAIHLLDKSSFSSEQKKLCRIIKQSEEHLLQLIDDILDLARIEAGQVRLEEKEFSLKKTLKKLIPGFELEAKEKGIKLDLVYPDSLPSKIVSDKGKLVQILSNLIANALKFTEKGKVEVRLKGLTDSKIQVFIKDTGVGIPKERLSHIFNKFYQVDGTLRRKYKGTGLGLTIVKGLVDFLGGEIEIKSELKKGSPLVFPIGWLNKKYSHIRNKLSLNPK